LLAYAIGRGLNPDGRACAGIVRLVSPYAVKLTPLKVTTTHARGDGVLYAVNLTP